MDIGKLAFTRGEVLQALRVSPREATRYLDDLRWFHSLDKAYRSRAAFDPQGLAALLADWFTQARFAPEVVQGRAHIHWRQTVERYEQAAAALRKDDITTAAIMFRESLHVLTRYLMERWGGRDNSWARFGTRFERMAAEQGEGNLAAEIRDLYGLAPSQVAHRMAQAPQGVQYRHRLSWAARQFVAEPVTAAQDARDVLLVLSTWELRYRQPPFAPWVGLETTSTVLAAHLAAYRQLLGRLQARDGLPWR